MSAEQAAKSVGLELEWWGIPADTLILQVASFPNACGKPFPSTGCSLCEPDCCNVPLSWRLSLRLRPSAQTPGTYALSDLNDASATCFQEFEGSTNGHPWSEYGGHAGGSIEIISIDDSTVQFRVTDVLLETIMPDAPTISGDYIASRCDGQ